MRETKANNRLAASFLLAVTLAAMAPMSLAANDALLELLKVLRDNGTINSEAYELLRNSALVDEEKTTAQQAQTVQQQVAAEVEKTTAGASDRVPEVTTKGKLEIADQNKDWKWRFGGRVQSDVTLVDSDDGIGGPSGHEFRRVRFYMSGTAWKWWDYKLQFDLEDVDDGSQAIEDAYIRLTKFKPLSITFGQTKAPFSLVELTSSKYLTFIERPTPAAVFSGEGLNIGGRAPGITLATHGHDLWSAAGGFYLYRQNDANHPRAIDDGIGFTGRVTVSPLHEKTRALHAGISGGYKSTSNKAVGRLRARPAVNLGPRIVDTDFGIGNDSHYALALEGAAVWGPFSVQGEYYHARLMNRGPSVSDYDMDGYYLFGSYFLTGESRNYNFSKAAFGSVKPNAPLFGGGFGAWEIAVRYSNTDLNDIGAGIRGDEGDVITAALNWYVNNNLMFKANYVKVIDCDPCDWGTGDEEPGYFLLRTQIFF